MPLCKRWAVALRELAHLSRLFEEHAAGLLGFPKSLWPPYFFFTASSADTKWVELCQTLYYQEHGRHATEDEQLPTIFYSREFEEILCSGPLALPARDLPIDAMDPEALEPDGPALETSAAQQSKNTAHVYLTLAHSRKPPFLRCAFPSVSADTLSSRFPHPVFLLHCFPLTFTPPYWPPLHMPLFPAVHSI
jgi:hypothetical protein